MKKRIALLIVLSIICTVILGLGIDSANAATKAPAAPAAPAAKVTTAPLAISAFQRVSYVNATVTGCEVLNVRQGPSTEFQVVNVLKKGQTVKVFGKLGNWYAIYEPETGCVGVASSSFLKETGAVAAAVPTTSNKQTVAASLPKSSSQTALPAISPVSGISQDEQSLLNLINKARSDAGVSALEFDADLMKDARLKAKDMVDNNYFSHQSPTYGSPFDMMKQFGISFKSAGENIAGNQSVEGAFKAWMSSEGHKKNILNENFNYCGIGIVNSQTYGKVLVQQFIGK